MALWRQDCTVVWGSRADCGLTPEQLSPVMTTQACPLTSVCLSPLISKMGLQ